MITAKELAKRLGVSPSAVSIALNGREGVSEETRRMILEEAKKLGYTGMRGPYHKKRETLKALIYKGFRAFFRAVYPPKDCRVSAHLLPPIRPKIAPYAPKLCPRVLFYILMSTPVFFLPCVSSV